MNTKTYYDLTRLPAQLATATNTDNVFMDGELIATSFYMPSEPAINPLAAETAEEATTAYGDRLNMGDLISLVGIPLGSLDTAMVSCGSVVTLVLEASYLTLSASLLSIAALL